MSKKKIVIVQAIFLVLFLSLIIMLTNFNKNITGFTVYTSQPSVEGKDTYIRENSDTNYGTQTTLKIGKTAAGIEYRSLIEFNLSSIPSDNTITSAILSLYVSSTTNSENITLKLYRVTSSWQETESGWNNASGLIQWSSSGGDYSGEFASANITNETGKWYNLTITTLVRNWINLSYNNYGIILLSNNANNGNYTDLASSDNGNNSFAPKITIDHTENAVPTIESISTDSELTSPKNTGQNITFTINWNDLEEDNAQVFICNSSDINASGCLEKTFCNTSASSLNPITCSYTITALENKTQNFYVAVCDSNCSNINQSYFYSNNFPNLTLIQPSGGETINQSQGNYLIKFNVSDSNADSLNATIYYGTSRNSENYTIASLNLQNYCTDTDSTTLTANNCSYSWNTTGVYGTYYLKIKVNDTYTISNKSSSSFNIYSLIDLVSPEISSSWTDSYIYSGKTTNIYSNITDENMDSAWISLNYTSSNITMSNSSFTYSGNFTAQSHGTYKYRISAKDKVENTEISDWIEFNVSRPNATTQNPIAPSTALPYSSIRITSQLNASDSLKNVYAYLNVPDGFIFISNYSQNSFLGNFSENETKTATWIISVPITESDYVLNATYTDQYSNKWNSTNMNLTVTSSISGYFVSISGYPEVETSNNYYAEAFFKNNGVASTPDSILISLYDSLGNLVSGPVSMTLKSVGTYNYSYAVGSSVNEGQWEARVNSSKSSVSYYASQFFKIVGGPFDVRSITVSDSSVNDLAISIIAENTGGANKDLTLIWNLTRYDNSQVLDSGSETFMVTANSERTWTINPSTSYIGQVKIEFLGYYSGTEKAGAYKIFSTTSGDEIPVTPPSSSSGGGGGSSPIVKNKSASFSVSYEKEISLTKNLEKTVYFEVENSGEKEISNLKLELNGLEGMYTLTPASIKSLKRGEKAEFSIKFLVVDFTGEKSFKYSLTSDEISKSFDGKINVLSIKEYFLAEILRLRQKISSLKADEISLNECKSFIDKAKLNINAEEYIDANENIKKADSCINKLIPQEEKPTLIQYPSLFWIITWILIIILIIVLISVVYIIYKKFSIINFLKQNSIKTDFKNRAIDKKLEKIRKRLEDHFDEPEN